MFDIFVGTKDMNVSVIKVNGKLPGLWIFHFKVCQMDLKKWCVYYMYGHIILSMKYRVHSTAYLYASIDERIVIHSKKFCVSCDW